jgi:peptidoglycan/LPS O-acetylase OafA/YrhL
MKKRNGLLEIYRFLLCFIPLYYHSFFYFERNYEIFTVPELTVDFFFMLSGFFLMSSMRRLKDEKTFVGMVKIMFDRVKPMLFTLCFISAFNLVCILIFVRENYLNTLFELFKYWWFVLFLTVGIGLIYLVYRDLKSEKLFLAFLVLLALGMASLHYFVVEGSKFVIEVVFFTRALGCISAGILVSYIPKIRIRKFNYSIPIVILLLPTLIYLFYNKKTFFICILMIFMFGALMYFSSTINVGGRIFDLLGKLSVRIYLYMAMLTMFYILGLTNHRVLFVIDLALAVMDLILDSYRTKYRMLEAKVKKQDLELAIK